MNGKIMLAIAAGLVAGWWLRGKATTRVQGGAAPTNLLQALMAQPALR